jgi:hypothetical protein
MNVAKACSSEQSTVTDRRIASVAVACALISSSSRFRPPGGVAASKIVSA